MSYSSQGPSALIDGLYLCVVMYATLGLEDVHPVADIGRLLAAGKGMTRALLTAIFVFSLSRLATR